MKTAIFALLFGCVASAMPILDSTVTQELSRLTAEPATRFLRDNKNADLVYPVLSRLTVANSEQGKPLFRMSQNKDGSAEIFVIVQLSPAKAFEEDFEALKSQNEKLRLALLPVATGKLKVSLLEGDQVTLLGESSEVQNAYLNANMPLHATVSAAGLQKVRASIATQSGILLALTFEYSFKGIVEGAPMRFRVRPQALREQIVSDREFSRALANGTGVSVTWAQRQVRIALGIDFNPAKPILPLNPIDTPNYPLLAWSTLFDLFPTILVGKDATSWIDYAELKQIRDRQDLPEVVEVESRPQHSIQLAKSQAGGLLKGICTKYANLVYRFDGTSSCDALVVPAEAPSIPPTTSPSEAVKPKPGDDKPRPGFDPLLD